MTDIEQLITMLQSDNPNERYEASQLLSGVTQPLSQEAINALRTATNDKDARVAEAAQRALAIHTANKDGVQTDKNKTAYIIFCALLGGGIAPFVSCFVIATITMGMGESLAAMAVLPSAIIGIIVGVIFGNISYDRKAAAQKQNDKD